MPDRPFTFRRAVRRIEAMNRGAQARPPIPIHVGRTFAMTNKLASHDGTTIVYDRTGDGPAVVLVHAGPFTRAVNAGLAALLGDLFTVYTYDRRGRGESGGGVTDGPEREFQDLAALIDEAGGSANVYGSSGAGIIGLQAAARGLAISRLAVWEPPYAV